MSGDDMVLVGRYIRLYEAEIAHGVLEDAGIFSHIPDRSVGGVAPHYSYGTGGVRLLVREVLAELGYHALEAADGQAALPILQSQARIDLLVSDVGLPGLNGRQVAEIARQHRERLPVLFMTGYAEYATNRAEFLAPGMHMIGKPFAVDQLAHRIRALMRGVEP